MIVVGTTLTTFAMDDPQVWGSWLENAEQVRKSVPQEVRFFAAIEVDKRGIEPFTPLVLRLLELVERDRQYNPHFVFSLDDGRTAVTTPNRQRHLTMGENLVCDYATEEQASHVLFVAADTSVPDDVLPKLLEPAHELVGANVPTYGLRGVPVERNGVVLEVVPFVTAACVLIDRQLFKRLKWRYDPELGMTDDPAYCSDARALIGVEAMIRQDVVCKHYPESIPPIEERGYDLTVER